MEQPGLTPPPRPNTRKAERLLLLLFLLSLPFLNPWVRGDGVGYYAFVRAPLIEHNLDFTKDYQHANESFRGPRLDEYGRPKSAFRTPTGHLDNHFTVGPAILWTPFLLLAHAAVLLARALGSTVAADGFSTPYRVTMALATALYGFLGLLLAFRLARQYVEERWAFLATLSIWWASSPLPTICSVAICSSFVFMGRTKQFPCPSAVLHSVVPTKPFYTIVPVFVKVAVSCRRCSRLGMLVLAVLGGICSLSEEATGSTTLNE